MRRRGERRFSRALELIIVVLVALVALEVLSQRDPFECRTVGRRLTDEELARESLAYLRSEQVDNALAPWEMPEGYAISDADALLADPRLAIDITRNGDGPGDILKPRRSWIDRQVSGAHLAVNLNLPAEVPGAPMLGVLHTSNPCGQVRADWGHSQSDQNPTPPLSAAE